MAMHRRFSPHPSPSDFLRAAPKSGRLPRFSADPEEAHAAALFLGPRAENEELLTRLINQAIGSVSDYRRSYLPGDPVAIDEAVQDSDAYRTAVDRLENKFTELLGHLTEHATPYFASRYQGHMLWDTLLPGIVGYFATMLHNPNNVTVQASTLTTFLELQVGWDLCTMFGYPFSVSDTGGRNPWGHITADGSVANLEAAWSARELKFFPLAVRALLDDARLATAAALAGQGPVTPLQTALAVAAPAIELKSVATSGALVDLSQWDLLNVPMEEALSLPTQVLAQLPGGIGSFTEQDIWEAVHVHSVSTVGLVDFYRHNMGEVRHSPVILASSTKHYSWPKALSVLGGGSGGDQLIDIEVDADARMNIDDLRRKLDKSLAIRRPVLLTVAVMGSTEEGACDPLEDVLAMREEYRAKGLDFNVHADAAWGGYLTSLIRNDFAEPGEGCDDPILANQDHVHLNQHTRTQLANIRFTDAVTVDPHKMGYIQYPAGALCYRDERMRNLVTFSAPVIGNAGSQVSVGEFGIEGSKPGAAPAAVYLAHSVLRPSTSGYGQLINEAMRSAKAFYLGTLVLADADDPFICVPLARLPDERGDGGVAATREGGVSAWKSAAEALARMPIDDILSDPNRLAEFNELGPDENLVDYAFNFKRPDGCVNKSIKKFNKLNEGVYDAFHVHEGQVKGRGIDYGRDARDYPLIITQTTMSVGDYGEVFMRSYATRLGLDLPPEGTGFELKVNRTVVMDPWLTHISLDGRPFLDLVFELLRNRALELAEAQQRKILRKRKKAE